MKTNTDFLTLWQWQIFQLLTLCTFFKNNFVNICMLPQNNLNIFLSTLGLLQTTNVFQLSWRTKLLPSLIPKNNKHYLSISLTAFRSQSVNNTLKIFPKEEQWKGKLKTWKSLKFVYNTLTKIQNVVNTFRDVYVY